VWDPHLKPTVDDSQHGVDSGTCTPRLEQSTLPAFFPNITPTTTAAFAEPVPSLPPSVAPTTSTEASDPYHVSTPKPDITMGLAHTGFEVREQRRLVDHQAAGSILSDPHAADMGIRFPFLIVEAKGLSLSGSLVSAQNQAAVSGASMLAILRDLCNQADGYINPAAGSGVTLEEKPALCFSIVTAGPIHEMNVHFMHEGAFHMHCFRAFRTTLQPATMEFVYFLCKVLEWGRGRYRSSIAEKLKQVPGSRAVP
jgi:hypothetical protein